MQEEQVLEVGWDRPSEGNTRRCQVDASWVYEGQRTGLGFVLIEGERRALMGLKNCNQTASPLHAEAEGLIWAMKMMHEYEHRSMHFETDCAQLLKLIQNLEEWPSMANAIEEIKINSNLFDTFSVSYIPHGINQRADCLAKTTRVCSDSFTSVCSETHVWLAHVGSLLE
ncbi:hypothetical protein Bca52824_034688 [Brassica carinata]|uniref:RNase H type-1 domain-containing protein n=1 Tax=Brassica carinata TaxID=52824 RepID=A0A8X7V205_BRACI|nr:hypothetical protein Bca52824_034688 [Brassica carinata]